MVCGLVCIPTCLHISVLDTRLVTVPCMVQSCPTSTSTSQVLSRFQRSVINRFCHFYMIWKSVQAHLLLLLAIIIARYIYASSAINVVKNSVKYW